MINPIIERELFGLLRTRKAMVLQISIAVALATLVVLRWPSEARVELSGAQSREVFCVFAYGLLTMLILLVPAFPATSLVREKVGGTLALLFNSPMSSWSIYFGKLAGVLGFALLMMVMSLPAAAACYAMGGISLADDLATLYVLLAVVAVQYTTLGLLVSSCANSADSALRITYGLVFLLAVVTLGPHLFLQGQTGLYPELAEWLRCLSPIPAVMEILGHGDVGSHGLTAPEGTPARYALLALAGAALFATRTAGRLNHRMLDRSRSQGRITDERSSVVRGFRRVFFLVDPQRRKSGIGPFVNPVMVKEFRSRRFGRLHWIFRLIAVCALVSLGLTYASTLGTLDWGVETIGGIMVLLQVALIVLLTPSLAAGLISAERESGGWELLRMTPLSAGTILRGKITSALATLVVILFATLPGYLVMIWVKPEAETRGQIMQVLACLALTAVFALLLSAAVGSLFRRTAPATTTAYALLVGLSAGTMLVWIGRDAPFGHSTVQTVLTVNPLAAAMSVIDTPGFTQYELLPANWWFLGGASVFCLMTLMIQTWRLTRPN
ncbi:MAG: ABC transporter permease [Planctomycetota bacterium]|jgi:ABC-type transport system involved in multi-copper enzyme maturation permease subunit